MKTLIIYESTHHGSTEKIAKAITDVLGAKLVKPEELDMNTMAEYDLLGFGSGIYMERHHKDLLNTVSKLSRQENKKAFIFSTSGAGERNIARNHKAMRKRLLEKGFTVAGEFSCRGFTDFGPLKLFRGVNKGRPNEGDLSKAKEFAKRLKNA
ncbi:MAG: flavodoxin family protein [Dehalococcoidia bacterium]|nr:flavodoxin family protein [Dehalococcoidia bacterium]